MKNFFYILIIRIMLLGTEVSAQTPYTLEGFVMDESDNLLDNIKVTLQPHGIATYCDPNGNFTLEVPSNHTANSNDSYTLLAEEIGYKDANIVITSEQLVSGLDSVVLKLETNPVSGDVLGFTVDMGGEDANFYVYVPDAVDSIRAAFYVSHHGIGDITREDMHKFAAEEEIALVGFLGNPVQRGIDPISKVDDYIDSLASLCGHPELPNVPIMTFGHSNGTGFASSFPRDRPEQCIAWLSYHPGFVNYLQYENTEKVPSMIMVGEVDSYYNPAYDETGRRGSRQDNVVYDLREGKDAPMNVMVEGGVGHSPKDSEATWAFVYEFLRAAMRIRLADDGSLKDVDIQSGWLGGHYDLPLGGRQMLEIGSYAEYVGEKSRANWFPDEKFARLWQLYGLTAKVCLPLVTGVSLTPETDSLFIGETVQLSTVISPSDAAYKNVIYSSSVDSIVAVSSNGMVRALSPGVAIVSVTTEDGAFKDSCLITVSIIPVSAVSVTPQIDSLYIGETLQLDPSITPSNATDQTLVYSSSDTSVAKVDGAGLIDAISAGTTIIQIKANNGVYDSFVLVVKEITNSIKVASSITPLFEIYPNPASCNLNVEIAISGTAKMSFINYTGQEVFTRDIQGGVTDVDISSISAGFYMLQVSNGHDNYLKKIIVK